MVLPSARAELQLYREGVQVTPSVGGREVLCKVLLALISNA